MRATDRREGQVFEAAQGASQHVLQGHLLAGPSQRGWEELSGTGAEALEQQPLGALGEDGEVGVQHHSARGAGEAAEDALGPHERAQRARGGARDDQGGELG